MRRLINSIQFQQLLIVVLLAAGVFLLMNIASTQLQTAQDRQTTANLLSQNRSAVYRMASVARRLANAPTPVERQSLLGLLSDEFRQYETVDESLEARPSFSGHAEFQAAHDDSHLGWEKYKTQLDVLMTAVSSGETASQVEGILRDIDAQSVVQYAVMTTELNTYEAISQIEARNSVRLFVGLGAAAVALLGLAAVILYLSGRATRNLAIAANSVAAGQYQTLANEATFSELSEVGRAFNQMAAKVQESLRLSESRAEDAQAARVRAERSDQVKSAFLASMSHELRTPLNAVINFTRYVADGDAGVVNAEQKELLTDVVNSAKHLLNLINDVLDMSKIEAGSLNLFIEDNIDVRALIGSVANTGRILLKDKPVRLEVELDADLPPLRADRQRILQILLNIVSNACKFTDQGDIRVRVQHTDGELLISVEDSGPGIAPEDQTLVFEAFKQTRTGLRKGGGTGLGMPIARSLAQAHGGRLWLDSSPGKGATFYVALPTVSALEPTLA